MKYAYMVEYVIEKKDGSVRFESHEYDSTRDITRLKINPKLKSGETLIRFTGQLSQKLV